MPTTSNFTLVVIGWDASNRLVQMSPPPLASPLIVQGGGCTDCVTGKRLMSMVTGPTFIDTDAVEMLVLEFINERDAQQWVGEIVLTNPNAFRCKQVYGYVPTWSKP